MAETIQNVVLCFPGETGSSRIFDDKTIQALDKRRRSKQRGLDTKGAPVLPILPNPTTNPTPPPQCNQPFPPQGPRRARSSTATRTTRKPGHTGRRIASPLPSACLVQQQHLSLSPSLSKRHDAADSHVPSQYAPRETISLSVCAQAPTGPAQIIPDTVDSTLAWQTQGYIAISRPTGGGSSPPPPRRQRGDEIEALCVQKVGREGGDIIPGR